MNNTSVSQKKIKILQYEYDNFKINVNRQLFLRLGIFVALRFKIYFEIYF